MYSSLELSMLILCSFALRSVEKQTQSQNENLPGRKTSHALLLGFAL